MVRGPQCLSWDKNRRRWLHLQADGHSGWAVAICCSRVLQFGRYVKWTSSVMMLIYLFTNKNPPPSCVSLIQGFKHRFHCNWLHAAIVTEGRLHAIYTQAYVHVCESIHYRWYWFRCVCTKSNEVPLYHDRVKTQRQISSVEKQIWADFLSLWSVIPQCILFHTQFCSREKCQSVEVLLRKPLDIILPWQEGLIWSYSDVSSRIS